MPRVPMQMHRANGHAQLQPRSRARRRPRSRARAIEDRAPGIDVVLAQRPARMLCSRLGLRPRWSGLCCALHRPCAAPNGEPLGAAVLTRATGAPAHYAAAARDGRRAAAA
jgi:hypothetical protein